MKSKLYWILFLLLLFVGSYYREVLFRSINSIIRGDEFFYAKTMELTTLKNWPIQKLVKFKYLLTILFSVFFMISTALGLRISFRDKLPYYIVVCCYGFLIAISIITGLIGISFYSFSEVYPILRMFIGWIHSPILFLFLSISSIALSSINIKSEEVEG